MNYEQSAKAQTERLMADGHATILAIESSCDETAAAIVRDGRQVISSVISSQIPLHAMYGGVVPEIASRAHVESVDPVVDEALKKAGMTLSDVDAVAVTYGPGLVGALLIGVSAAKALAYAAGKPLVPVNHIEGTSARTMWRTPIWSRRSSVWWPRAATAISSAWRITACIPCSGRRWTTRRARHLTRRRACSVCRIRAGRCWISSAARATRTR